jgi:hypothetical protein
MKFTSLFTLLISALTISSIIAAPTGLGVQEGLMKRSPTTGAMKGGEAMTNKVMKRGIMANAMNAAKKARDKINKKLNDNKLAQGVQKVSDMVSGHINNASNYLKKKIASFTPQKA